MFYPKAANATLYSTYLHFVRNLDHVIFCQMSVNSFKDLASKGKRLKFYLTVWSLDRPLNGSEKPNGVTHFVYKKGEKIKQVIDNYH